MSNSANNEPNEDDDPIGKSLGLEPINKNIEIIDNMIAECHDDSAKKDFELARSNITNIILNGTEAISSLAQIADQSQQARAFEVLAKLMDSMVNANKELLNLQTKIREIENVNKPINDQAKTINNNLGIFVGSTAELQKAIKSLTKEPNLKQIELDKNDDEEENKKEDDE